MKRSQLLVAGLAALVILAAAGAYFWGAKKTQDLESSAQEGMAAATSALRAALAKAGDAAAIEAQGAIVAQALQALQSEDASRNKALYEAAELYLVDVQAMLRNQASAARAAAAAHAASRALERHLDAAAGRGPGWIQEALARKSRAERAYFDWRTALGALAGLYDAHRETQARLRAAAPQAPMLGEEERLALFQGAQAADAQAAAELERLRRLPIA
ncbi:MAG: hypothetical protein AB7S87_14105 [Burkholderiales bacterium]